MKNWHKISKREKLEIFNKIALRNEISSNDVEKDWWITETIHLIFQTRLSSHLSLKGGIAFNKAWNLHEKNADDIHLALDKSFYGFNGSLTTSQLTTIKTRLYNYINEQFYPSLKQKFKDKELNVLIHLNENNIDQNMVVIEIYYSSILKYPKHTKSKITLKIDYNANWKSFKLKSLPSLIESQYEKSLTSESHTTHRIPCLSPQDELV
jgi:hypothetical protein